MLDNSETYDVLNRFGKTVVRQAKNNLRRKKKLASKNLDKSLDYDINVSKNSFQFDLFAEDYWKFVDAGVKGVGGTKADGTKWKKKRVTNSKFKYKTKRPPIMAFNGWTIRKGIAPRSKGGQFTKRRGLLHAISTSVFHTGLETTNFLTKPFEKEFKELPDELIEAYALDVDEFIKFSIL